MNATGESQIPTLVFGLVLAVGFGSYFLFDKYFRSHIHLTPGQYDALVMNALALGLVLTRDVPYSVSYIAAPYVLNIVIGCTIVVVGFAKQMNPRRALIATMSMASVSVLSAIIHIMHAIHYDMRMWVDFKEDSPRGMVRVNAPWFYTIVSFVTMLITFYGVKCDAKSIKVD